MRSHSNSPPPPSKPAAGTRGDLATLKTLLPYLWVYKWRVLMAMLCLVGAKMANVGVPLVLKQLIDQMNVTPTHPQAMLVLPLGVLAAYGAQWSSPEARVSAAIEKRVFNRSSKRTLSSAR